VVVLATEEYVPGSGFSIDAATLDKATWTEEDQREVESLKRESGFFESPDLSETHVAEYPADEHGV
jgi:hypothetical protein